VACTTIRSHRSNHETKKGEQYDMPRSRQGVFSASQLPDYETTAYTMGAVVLLAQVVTLCQANTRGVGIWAQDTMVLKRIDQSCLGFIRKVIFFCQNSLAFKEFLHCLLYNINTTSGATITDVKLHISTSLSWLA